MTNIILFITNKEDITTDFIVNKLNKLGESYYRLNTEDLISKIGINFDFENHDFEIIDHSKNLIINTKNIRSVYYRRPKLPLLDYYSIKFGEKKFLLSEITYLLEGFYKILFDKFWISPVFSIREAENKIYQLIKAKKLGFEIPKSLITTNEEKAKYFIELKNQDCVIKAIKTGFIEDNEDPKIIFTSLLKKENLNSLYRVKYFPTFFQNKIDKEADIRITVVGNKIFPAKIKSQAFEDSKIDWRKGSNPTLEYEHFDIPKKLEEKCLKLTKIFGLKFSAIDLILNKNNKYIFLELNPNGQWAWIEKKLEFDISGEITKLLIGGAYNK